MVGRGRAAAAAIPAWGWLTIIVLVSFAGRAWLARGMAGPFIMVDELFYSELGRSLADARELAIRGAQTTGYGLLYPLLIAPAYWVADSLVDAYTLVKTTNALVMSLAAIPAYLLARRVVGRRLALLAAVAAVLVPSMAYTGSVMTENAFYPLVLTVVLLQVRALEHPTRWRQLAVLAAIAVTCLVRIQAASLLLGVLTAPLLLGAIAGGFRRTVLAQRLTYALTAVAAIAVVGLQAARGRSLTDLFGAYAIVGETSYDTRRVLEYLAYHLAELDLYLAGVPIAATVVLLARSRRLEPALQAYLAGILASSAWIVVVASVFASRHAGRIQERNVFTVVPLFVIVLLAWLERGAPRPRRVAIPAAVGAAAAVLVIPFEDFVTTSAVSDTLMLLPWWAVLDKTGVEWIPLLVVTMMAAFAALFLLVPRRYALLVPLAVLVYWVVAFKPIWFGSYPWGYRQASVGAVFQGIRSVDRDWIDAAVGRDADVGVVWTGRPDRMVVNQNEFFNRSVGTIYYTRDPTPGGGGLETRVVVGPDGVVRTEDGRVLPERLFLITDGSIEPDGEEIARDELLGVSLWRSKGPLVSLNVVTGMYPDDTWSGPRVTYTRRRCDGGRLRVALGGDPNLFDGPTRITAVNGGGGRFAIAYRQDERPTWTVPLASRDGRCTVAFAIAPTAVPAEVVPGSGDDRVLGTHFYSFDYLPPR